MDDLEKICGDFVEEVKTHGGGAIRAVVLHGSALGSEFRPGVSDYNFAILAEPIDMALLLRLAARTGKWRKKRITTPLLLTPLTVERSLDSYPLEFLALKARYRVLFGVDFLKDLTFKKEDVRLQCERELRSKLLLLRRACLETEGAPKRLQQLLARGLPSLVAIFRGMLFLKDGAWDSHGNELHQHLADQLGFSAAMLDRLHEVRRRRSAPSREEIQQHLGEVLALLQQLADEVDRW